jgi:serine acetyltransferase
LNASTHPHTTIAKGVMIGAQSFVKGNTIEFSTYVGCPAKYIGENHRLIERLNGTDN